LKSTVLTPWAVLGDFWGGTALFVDVDDSKDGLEEQAIESQLLRLKNALEALGLKCGGTLEERAQRLWAVKGLAASEFPKKLLAKKKQAKNTE